MLNGNRQQALVEDFQLQTGYELRSFMERPKEPIKIESYAHGFQSLKAC